MSYARQFWMVWNPNGRAPTHCHPTEASAVEEAKRLARMNKGQNFIVLAATHSIVVDPVTVRRLMTEGDDIARQHCVACNSLGRPACDCEIPF